MELTTETLAENLMKRGIKLFTERSGFPLSQAQRNLEGRSNYVDDDTLRVYDGKVTSCVVTDNGLMLGIVESIRIREEPAGRVYRPVFFDVFGNIIYRPDLDDSFLTSKSAGSEFWKQADEIDVIKATMTGILSRKNQLTKEADKLQQLFDSVNELK